MYLRCIWVDLVWIEVDLRCIFVDLTYMFLKFQQALKLAESREKLVPTFFAFLPPLYRRFRPSGALQTVDLEEIYRFLSKILDFMPCGSVFGHFCVLCTNLMALASKIYRKSIEHLLKIYRKTVQYRARRHEMKNF